ncbi:hypothetical protein Pfo_010212 [Paulownia fortunei]|nr:hypothetical protein Pfo_010212 [Paulownia fortunei]
MEGTNTLSSSGVTVVGSDAPSDYHVAPRTTIENPAQVTGSAPPTVTVTPAPVSVTPPPSAAAGVATGVATGVGGATTLKKKRGRPRKYGPDGSVAMALSPKPISSSAPPPVIDFSAVEKRGKVRAVGSAAKLQLPRMETESLGIGLIILHFTMCVFECYCMHVHEAFFYVVICVINVFCCLNSTPECFLWGVINT